MVERSLSMREVLGSMPNFSTFFRHFRAEIKTSFFLLKNSLKVEHRNGMDRDDFEKRKMFVFIVR